MRRTPSLLLAALLAGCNAAAEQPDTAASAAAPAADPDSAVPATPAAAPVADSVAADTAAGDVAADAAVLTSPAVRIDGADTVVSVPRPEWRTKRDSMQMVQAIRAGLRRGEWPTGPAALPGAILPNKRIIAYYGNPLSKKMGVLGEYEVDDMLARLDREVAAWQKADPATPVQPALHLVAVVAQGAAGKDGMWRTRMDSALIEKVYGWAKRKDAILFLDIQTGWSTIQQELPRLRPWLERPDVHLGIDPEFNMHRAREGVRPSAKIGTYDAEDVNYVVRTLSDIVKEKGIPPKVLVVHRFTKTMLTNAERIRPTPQTQVVIHMDGWGAPWLKFDSYNHYIVREPVQYTGFKLFYHNDTKKGDRLLTPGELVKLVPAPLYIQYQ